MLKFMPHAFLMSAKALWWLVWSLLKYPLQIELETKEYVLEGSQNKTGKQWDALCFISFILW